MADSEQKARRIDAGGDSNQSSKSVSQTSRSDEKKRIKERDEEWGFKPSRGGIATEAKMGMMIIVILVLAFCFLVYHKFDLRQKELLAAQVKGSHPTADQDGTDTIFPLKESVDNAVDDLQQAIAAQSKPEESQFARQSFQAALAASESDEEPPRFGDQTPASAAPFENLAEPVQEPAGLSAELLASNDPPSFDAAPSFDAPAAFDAGTFDAAATESSAPPTFESLSSSDPSDVPVFQPADNPVVRSTPEPEEPDPFTLLMEQPVASADKDPVPPSFPTEDSSPFANFDDDAANGVATAEPAIDFAAVDRSPANPISSVASEPADQREPAGGEVAGADFSAGQFEPIPLLEDESVDDLHTETSSDATEFASLSETTPEISRVPSAIDFDAFGSTSQNVQDPTESFPALEPGPSPFDSSVQQPTIEESPLLAMIEPPDVNVFEREAAVTQRAQPNVPTTTPVDDSFPTADEPEAPFLSQPRAFDREPQNTAIEPAIRSFEPPSSPPETFDPPKATSKLLIAPEPELNFAPIEDPPAVPIPREIAPSQPLPEFSQSNSFNTPPTAQPSTGRLAPIRVPVRSYEPPRGPEWNIESARAQFSENSPSIQLVSGSTVNCDICEVRPKDTYWTISKRAYGTAVYFSSLALYNQKRIPDPKRLRPGMKVLIPPPERLEKLYPEFFKQLQKKPRLATGFFVKADGSPAYRIGEHETLSRIAQKHLGRASRWIQLYRMNTRVLRDPNKLKPGTVIDLPDDATNVQIAP